MFLGKVREKDGVETDDFVDGDYDTLSKHNLNGRQVPSLPNPVYSTYMSTNSDRMTIDQERRAHCSSPGRQREDTSEHGPSKGSLAPLAPHMLTC